MAIRPATFVSALVVGLVAVPAVAIASDEKAASITECLAGPKGTPPGGGHWFYRIDRSSHRRCWFVGDEQQKPAHEKRAAVEEKPVHRKSKPAMLRPIANARAEMQASRAAADPSSVPPTRVATAAPPTSDDSATADALLAIARATLARRWSDQADAGATTGPEPTITEKVDADTDAPSKATRDASPARDLTLAAVTRSPEANMSGSAKSVGMLMIVLGASLSLAGLIASAVFRFGQR